MHKLRLVILTLVTTGLNSLSCYASPITPSVPNVAGATLNDMALLGEANGQSSFAIPSPALPLNHAQENLSDSITSVFGEISTNVANKIFTSTSGQSGSFLSGNDTISYQNINGNISVTVTDNISGQSTTLSGI